MYVELLLAGNIHTVRPRRRRRRMDIHCAPHLLRNVRHRVALWSGTSGVRLVMAEQIAMVRATFTPAPATCHPEDPKTA